jgi:hypothetical protein
MEPPRTQACDAITVLYQLGRGQDPGLTRGLVRRLQPASVAGCDRVVRRQRQEIGEVVGERDAFE